MRIEHRLDWGRTPGGKRYALCSCGWRAPARSKLTHGMSDARDHLADLRREAAAQGWQWWMLSGLGFVSDDAAGAPPPADAAQPPALRNPASARMRSRAELVAADEAKKAARVARRVARSEAGSSQVP